MKFETKFNLDQDAYIIIYAFDGGRQIAEIRQVTITGVSCYQSRRKKSVEINYYTDVKNGAIKEEDLFLTQEEARKAIKEF